MLRLAPLLSLTLTALGGLAAGRVLQRRRAWEARHNRVAIAVDCDDVSAAAIRAGQPLETMLCALAEHGATHVSLPELTLNRLRATGRLTPRAPTRTGRSKTRLNAPPVGHWNYLHGAAALVAQLADELAARLPYTAAHVSGGETLVFAGDLITLGEIGLGFEAALAESIQRAGLACLPRPVSYAWPDDRLIDLTLTQAAVFGKVIAFDGDLILGHELHLEATLRAMEREDLWLAYFAESRHQKGDWFVAKRRAPAGRVVLAHRFTPQAMIPLDSHAAAYHWAHLARERGIRLCYVNFFRVLHAAEPLEGLHYIAHIKEALEHTGFVVSADVCLPQPVPHPQKEDLALVGLASAGVAASAVNAALAWPDSLAVPFTVAAAGGALTLPYLEKPRNRLEEQYPPSYAPKLLALASAALAPVAAVQAAQREGAAGWMSGLIAQAAAAASLAAATSGRDYYLRIETYKGFNLDWALPLASAALSIAHLQSRITVLAAIIGLWIITNQHRLDLLAHVDPAPPEGHTHHLSTFARLLGDAALALGPQPARKWAGLGPFATALSLSFAHRQRKELAALSAALGALGSALGLVGFRRSERAFDVTLREAAPSFGLGAALGLALVLRRK